MIHKKTQRIKNISYKNILMIFFFSDSSSSSGRLNNLERETDCQLNLKEIAVIV